MGKRRIVVMSVVTVAILIATLAIFHWFKAEPLDPIYKGKPLSYWLQGYIIWSPNPKNGDPDSNDAHLAVTHLGSKALPYLLNLLREKESPTRDWFINLSRRQRFLKINSLTTTGRISEGMQAFDDLNSDGVEAIPQLIQIYETRPSPGSQQMVTYIISAMGYKAKSAVPFLIRAADNTNDIVRNNSLCALGNIHYHAKQVVPLMIAKLQDSSGLVRAQAAASLAKFGQEAHSAIPELVALLKKEKANALAMGTSGTLLSGVGPVYTPSAGSSSSLPRLRNVDIVSVLTTTITRLDPTVMANIDKDESSAPK